MLMPEDITIDKLVVEGNGKRRTIRGRFYDHFWFGDVFITEERVVAGDYYWSSEADANTGHNRHAIDEVRQLNSHNLGHFYLFRAARP